MMLLLSVKNVEKHVNECQCKQEACNAKQNHVDTKQTGQVFKSLILVCIYLNGKTRIKIIPHRIFFEFVIGISDSNNMLGTVFKNYRQHNSFWFEALLSV